MVAPGTCWTVDQISRACGMFFSSSLSKFVPLLVLLTSTAGDSPVTITLSVTDATFIVWSTVVTTATRTGMSDRSIGANPCSSNFTR